MIPGERIYLTPVEPDASETYRAWINDPEVHEWLVAGHIPITAARERAIIEGFGKDDSVFVFEIRLIEGDRPIGLCGLHGVEMPHRQAEIGILIGEKELWGQGLGRDAIVTGLRFGFETLGLHRIEISAFEGNDRALALYPSIGFQQSGRDRHRVFLRGHFWDAVVFDMLEDEFRERYGSNE